MIERRLESDQRIIDRVAEALQRPVEIRGSGVGEKKVIEALGNEAPAANQRITQNERGIVPDKPVADSRSIADEDNREN